LPIDKIICIFVVLKPRDMCAKKCRRRYDKDLRREKWNEHIFADRDRSKKWQSIRRERGLSREMEESAIIGRRRAIFSVGFLRLLYCTAISAERHWPRQPPTPRLRSNRETWLKCHLFLAEQLLRPFPPLSLSLFFRAAFAVNPFLLIATIRWMRDIAFRIVHLRIRIRRIKECTFLNSENFISKNTTGVLFLSYNWICYFKF